MQLPRPTLDAADRLIALATLVDAVCDHSTLPEHTVRTVFTRLATLIATLIRIIHFGVRAPRRPNPDAPARTPPTASADPDRDPHLPRQAGWLLAALPDLAPAIAADLGRILADPALATLFAALPTVHRALRPILRALDLPIPEAPPPTPPITPTQPSHPLDPSPPSPLTDPQTPPHKRTTPPTRSLRTPIMLR